MITAYGNKTLNINKQELEAILKSFKQVVVDLGAGDGNYIFKEAQKNPDIFYIGIDPIQKQFDDTARKIIRKKIKNIILATGSVENLPKEIYKTATQIYINMPWGSLLEKTVKPDNTFLENLISIFKKNTDCKLIIITGYSSEFEPTQTFRLGLEQLDENFINNEILPKYCEAGFKHINTKLLE